MYLVLESAVVTSQCPLLPAESASEYSPQVCMQVPSHSAWVPMQLDLSEFADDSGEVSLTELEPALQRAVDDGEQQHDRISWPEPRIEYDSWLNRRLAIALRGWGDIVELRGEDPQSLQTLRYVETLAEWCCCILHQHSRHLAAQQNWCPALDEAGALVMQQKQSRTWGRRWKKAVQAVAVRHRNLTTISPWDVFPRYKKADLRFADLLPLTRFADSLAFQCDVSIDHWNVNDFKGFYERVAAIRRCNGGASFVATQV